LQCTQASVGGGRDGCVEGERRDGESEAKVKSDVIVMGWRQGQAGVLKAQQRASEPEYQGLRREDGSYGETS
jgi:hypothetical protein